MKKFCRYAFGVLLAGLFCTTAGAQQGKKKFVIEGEVKDMARLQKVYLVYDSSCYQPTDSAVILDGKYIFRGSLDGISRVYISENYFDNRNHYYSGGDQATLFIGEGTTHTLSFGNLYSSTVNGSPADQDFRKADKRRALLVDSLIQIAKMGKQTKNTVLIQSVMGRFNEVVALVKKDYPDFVRQHPGSPVSLYLLQDLSVYQEAGELDSTAALYQRLSADMRSGRQGQAVGRMLTTLLRTALGHKAMDFTQNDTAGHPVSLSSFKGKYVLLDFWASWDNNAARALPVLAGAEGTYGSKGLVVLGVSLDVDKSSWLQTIGETNSGAIQHVSDLKGRANVAAQLYGITALPKNMLIDPNGVIIARNLNSGNLDKTLSSIFK